jgi:hypothetical protein
MEEPNKQLASRRGGVEASLTCCFSIDPIMVSWYLPNLWVDALHSSGCMPPGLPWGPLRNYNILAVGLDWDRMEYHQSAVGSGMPKEVVIEDWRMTTMGRNSIV